MLTYTRPDPKTAPLALAKLQDPFKKTLDTAQKDLKPIYSGLNKYGKALDKACLLTFTAKPLDTNNIGRNSRTSPSPPPRMTPSHPTPRSSTAP
jgi:hypothetical protein